MAEMNTILVTGATGRQGGAIARVLVARGHRVRTMTRKPDSLEARELRKIGAEVVSATFDDRMAMERVARGVDVIFAMSTPYEAGPAVEVSQAFGLLQASKAAGVRRIIYSSVASANQNTGIPHFESKMRVEQYLPTLNVPWTIVAPVFFMENFISPSFVPGLRQGKLMMPLPATHKLQMIAVADLAAFVGRVLESPADFEGKRIELASDNRSGMEAAEILARAAGRETVYEELPLDQARAASEDTAKMYAWFRERGHSVDIDGLRRDYPSIGWHTLEAWAREQDWNVLKPPVQNGR